MGKINRKNKLLLLVLVFFSCRLIAQVQVSKEPRHHVAFENKFVRILDVWLPPHDTSQFHIHSTPSLFLPLSTANVSSQIQGKEWTSERMETGKSWYRSFSPDSMIHRVSNIDTIPFHVADIEMLSTYDSINSPKIKPLTFPVLYDNERAIAYNLPANAINQNSIKARGPMVIFLTAGTGVTFKDAASGKTKELLAGKFLYVEPGTLFSLSTTDATAANLVIFEIK